MDSDRYDQNKLDRYGKTGILYQVGQSTNPETRVTTLIIDGTFEPSNLIPWNTK
jgi:hypothetical protein